MRRITALLTIVVVLGACLAAQQKKSSPATGVKKTAPSVRPQPATGTTATKPEAGEPLPTEATINGFLKHMFSYDPSVTYQILSISPSRAAGVVEVLVSLKNQQGEQRGLFYVMPDRKYAIAGGELIPFGADPFAPARQQLAAANGISRGPANAAVTIVEFSDLECPACKAAQPTIDKLIGEEPDVRFIFQNFPLENMHPWAFLAAKYADCVAQQDKDAFWKFLGSVYQNQDTITALLPTAATNVQDAMKQAEPAIGKRLQELAGGAGANSAQVAVCTADPSTSEHIRQSIALGKRLDITGTPTVFINGRRIQNVSGMPYETLKAMVDSAKKLANE